jgi:Putative enzyme of poly-gamma-glutamate biosynthesis (capsule formation)
MAACNMFKKVTRLFIILALLASLLSSYTISQAEDIVKPSVSNDPKTTTKTTKAADATIIKLSFAGDVMFEKKIEDMIAKNSLSYLFSEVKPYFVSSDISMVNLETPVSKRGIKEIDKQFTFRSNPDVLKNFTKASGINFVSLANNHILDFGRLAFQDTLNYLKKEKINHTGAGENIKKAIAPIYVKKNGQRIAVIAASRVIPFNTWFADKNKSGVASTYNPELIKNTIKEAHKKSDIIVVYVHWGNEKVEYPIKVQKDLAKLYIDNGADIVIGSHPHVLEGIEIYKNKVIAYSLGNFVFTDKKKDTMIFNITIKNKKITSLKIIPCEIQNYKPVIIKDKKKYADFISKMNKLSYNVRIDKKGNVSINQK